jgi:hypothetical protein
MFLLNSGQHFRFAGNTTSKGKKISSAPGAGRYFFIKPVCYLTVIITVTETAGPPGQV